MKFETVLTSIWEMWKRIGRAIGDLIGRVVLTVFYFTIFAPFGVIVRLFRRNPEGSVRAGNWITRELTVDDMTKGKRLY